MQIVFFCELDFGGIKPPISASNTQPRVHGVSEILLNLLVTWTQSWRLPVHISTVPIYTFMHHFPARPMKLCIDIMGFSEQKLLLNVTPVLGSGAKLQLPRLSSCLFSLILCYCSWHCFFPFALCILFIYFLLVHLCVLLKDFFPCTCILPS